GTINRPAADVTDDRERLTRFGIESRQQRHFEGGAKPRIAVEVNGAAGNELIGRGAGQFRVEGGTGRQGDAAGARESARGAATIDGPAAADVDKHADPARAGQGGFSADFADI